MRSAHRCVDRVANFRRKERHGSGGWRLGGVSKILHLQIRQNILMRCSFRSMGAEPNPFRLAERVLDRES